MTFIETIAIDGNGKHNTTVTMHNSFSAAYRKAYKDSKQLSEYSRPAVWKESANHHRFDVTDIGRDHDAKVVYQIWEG